MGNGGNLVDVGHARVGVAEGLDEHRLGVGLESGLYGIEVGRVDQCGLDAILAQCVLQQVGGAAVEVVGGNHVVAGLGHVEQAVGHGCGAAGQCQCGCAPFEGGHTFFKHVLCRVGQAAVYVACIAQPEAVGAVLAVVEHIACSLVDGHGAAVGYRVGLFLAHMQLQSLKMQFLVLVAHIVVFFLCLL